MERVWEREREDDDNEGDPQPDPGGGAGARWGRGSGEAVTVCDVVLPCRDEARALVGLLPEVPEGLRVIVVDNGSRDGTATVAEELGATVVSEPTPGYGAAVHAGLMAATAELVAFMDGDGSFDPVELLPLVEDVGSGRVDIAVGRRRPTVRGTWPWHA